MVALRVYVPSSAVDDVLTLLTASPAVHHLMQLGRNPDGGQTLITADVDSGAVDVLLPELTALGVAGDDIELVHRDSSRPVGTTRASDIPSWSGSGLAWSELSMTSRQYARAVPQYLVVMACGGVIAAFGVLTRNVILIVGAMAISPDLLPMCACCVGLAEGRRRLAVRALLALVVGLAVAALTAFVVSALLRWNGYPPATIPLGDGGLGVLPRVNVATIVVAFVAGIAGILAFETRSSSAVGVAISITTIPAAAFIGAALAEHEWDPAASAVAVLATNVALLIVGGTLTLLAQRRYRRHRR